MARYTGIVCWVLSECEVRINAMDADSPLLMLKNPSTPGSGERSRDNGVEGELLLEGVG